MGHILRAARWFCLAALLLIAQEARAEAPWLVVRAGNRCASRGDELAVRIGQAVAGARNPALRIDVQLADRTPATAVVTLLLGARVVGTKTLEARTCDEALDAVAAVVALALSSVATAQPDAQAPVATVATPEQTPLEQAKQALLAQRPAREVASARRLGIDAADQTKAHRPGLRLLAGVGLDVGTLARPTVLAGGGAALALGRTELRAIGRYGVPYTTEEVAEARGESLRADFGAAALDACWALDRARWLSACGGLELSLKRSIYGREAPGEPRRETKQIDTRFGPLAGLSFVLRDVPGQPQLELSAQLPLVGRAPALGFRAALAGGMLF
jgi:hypothetical protein